MDSQIERLRAQKEYYETKANNLELEKERLQSEILRLFTSNGFRDTQILELQNNLANAQSRERDLQARYNETLTQARVQINDLHSEILDLRADLGVSDEDFEQQSQVFDECENNAELLIHHKNVKLDQTIKNFSRTTSK